MDYIIDVLFNLDNLIRCMYVKIFWLMNFKNLDTFILKNKIFGILIQF